MLRMAGGYLFFPPKLGDPSPTSEPISPFYHPLLLQSPSLTTQLRGMAYRSPPSSTIVRLLWKALIQTRGGGGSLPSPVFGFTQEGAERLSAVPCARVYTGGEGTALFSPLCWVLQQRGTALYCSLCAVLYNRGGGALYRPLCSALCSRAGRLSTVPCVRFYVEDNIVFEGRDGVRYPPPPVGKVEVGKVDVCVMSEIQIGHPRTWRQKTHPSVVVVPWLLWCINRLIIRSVNHMACGVTFYLIVMVHKQTYNSFGQSHGLWSDFLLDRRVSLFQY